MRKSDCGSSRRVVTPDDLTGVDKDVCVARVFVLDAVACVRRCFALCGIGRLDEPVFAVRFDGAVVFVAGDRRRFVVQGDVLALRRGRGVDDRGDVGRSISTVTRRGIDQVPWRIWMDGE